MRSQGDLRIMGTAGEAPRLGLPIPEFAYLGLPALTMARIQEWLVWDDTDPGTFVLIDQRFRVLSWADAEKALLVAWVGPAPR
jgi:hypothetical protein